MEKKSTSSPTTSLERQALLGTPGAAQPVLRSPGKAGVLFQAGNPAAGTNSDFRLRIQKWKESLKQGWVSHSIAITVLIGLILVSFIFLFTSFEESMPSR